MAKSSLDKKFDQIRKREEEKTFSTKKLEYFAIFLFENKYYQYFMYFFPSS